MTIGFVSLVEIVAYVILLLHGEETFSLQNRYLWTSVVAPIGVNALAHTIVRVVSRRNITERKKNADIIYAVWVTAAVVALFHHKYWVTSCAFAFPVMLSGIFDDTRLCNRTFAASLAAQAVATVWLCLNEASGSMFWISQCVTYGFTLICYCSAHMMIFFMQQNNAVISHQETTNDQLRDRVKRDPMTGLYNHRAFFGELNEAINACEAKALPLSLAILDIDDFKSINDRFGHDCGDIVLLSLSELLQTHCGENDRACRYGGEEFAVIFPGKTLQETASLLRNVLADFSAKRYAFTDRAVTFSCGITAYRGGWEAERFFSEADRMLYRAKRSGKKRVCTELDEAVC